jgi:hypothetical protein
LTLIEDDGDVTVSLMAGKRIEHNDCAPDGHVLRSVATSSLSLTLDPTIISENEGVSIATVTRTGSTTDELVVNLTALGADAGSVDIPTSVTIGTGQSSSAPFNVKGVDDADTNGTRVVTLTASADDIVGDTINLTVTDDEAVTLTLSLEPSTISENGGVSELTVTRSGTTTGALVLSLGATGRGSTSLLLPGTTFTIPDGSSTATVQVVARDDDVDNGTRIATLTVSAIGIPAAASGELQITDDESEEVPVFSDGFE